MDSIVVGAGMVGVSTALALQERGYKVLLVDRRWPGQETSYGNAGIIQTEAVQPYAIPLSIPRLTRIALGNAHDVAWRASTAHRWLNPLACYFWNSLPANYAKIVPHYAKMIQRAADDHAPLIAASGSNSLIRKTGFIQAYRTAKGFDAAHADAHGTLEHHGVPFSALTPDQLQRAEPNLRVKMNGAIHYTSVLSCSGPGELVERYADLFIGRGGQLETASAQSLSQVGAAWRITTDRGNLEAKDVVVALGPWSPKFLAPLGYRIPMIFKRGYHRHFATGTGPSRPFMDVDNSTVLSPMKAGLRVLTGAELNSVEGLPDYRQIEHSASVANELFGVEEAVEKTPWRGARPCMPNMLPATGKASKHDGLWFNFGHGHQGFTLGPTTGILVADAIVGENKRH